MTTCWKFLTGVLLLFPVLSFASLPDPQSQTDSATANRPNIEAVRVTNPIEVDGALTETEWQRPGMSNFVQRDPIEGAPPSQKTEVWVAYDDEALYIAARMHDTAPDSIVHQMGRRDAFLSTDRFYVGIDSYLDRRTGFYFRVSVSGAISDGIMFNDSWDDDSWDGIWDAATTVDDKGWTAEMKIPYSQLRFAKQDEYTWGIQFGRNIERHKEQDYFVMVPKSESGWVSRFGTLTGIRNINPPTHIEVVPYVVSSNRFTNQFSSGDPFNDGTIFSGNIGADFKMGLGSNLTLNGSINPDFGQVEVDPAVVNLSQYETFFQEKRPFFLEGWSIFDFGYGGSNNNWGFNFGNPDYFYSRRIGTSPRGATQHDDDDNQGDIYTDYPDRSHIIGAAKLTGKIADGWSLGVMNAMTARENARVDSGGVRFTDVVEPFTYYGVVRSQREFNEGRRAIGFIGTAVMRDFNQVYLNDQFNHQSFAFGMDGWTELDADRTWVVTGWASTTRVTGSKERISNIQQNSLHYFQRPDASYLSVDPDATSLAGYAGRIALNKQKGNFYTNAAVGIISPGFDSNDLGFMFRTDVINSHLVLGYRWFEPDGIFRRKGINLATFRSYNYGGDRTGEGYFLFWNATLMNYWFFDGQLTYNPAIIEPRNTRGGPRMRTTNGYTGYLYGETDSRNPFVFEMGVSAGRTESGGYRLTTFPAVLWKPTSGLSLRFSPEINRDITIAQWVTDPIADPTATHTYGSRYIFGKIDQREYSASIRVDWTFTPKLSLQMYFQPLISVGTYTEFKELREPTTYTFNKYGIDNNSTIEAVRDGNGNITEYRVDPDGSGSADEFVFSNPDYNFKSLRGNMILRWEFLPGSAAYFVWTRNQNRSNNPGEFRFGRDFSDMLFAHDHDDVFLVKIAYWIHP